MGTSADGNLINAGGRDLPNVSQGDATARFKSYFVFAKRDRLPNLRRLHIVEENHVNAVDLQKRANLLERVGLNFNSNIRSRLAELLHCLCERGKSRANG